MCHRTSTAKNSSAKPFKTNLKTNNLLHVLYMKPKSQMHPTPNNLFVNGIGDKILNLLISVFDSFNTDERDSVNTCLTNGYSFLLYALNASGNKRTLIGAVLFSTDEDGIWINWLGIAAGSFDRQKFGKKSFYGIIL